MKEQAEARKAVEATSKAERNARLKVEKLSTTLTNKTATREDLNADCTDLRRRVRDATKTLQLVFPRGIPADAASELTQRRESVEAAVKALDETRQAASQAHVELQGATGALVDLHDEVSQLDTDIARLRARCEAAHRDVIEASAVVAYAGELAVLPTVAAAREAHAWLSARYETAFPPYYDSGQWGVPASPELMETAPTFYEATNAYSVDARALLDYWAFTTVKHLGEGQFYLMAIRDKAGAAQKIINRFHCRLPYRLHKIVAETANNNATFHALGQRPICANSGH